LHRASVCCAMISFTASTCVSICSSVRNLIDRPISESGKNSGKSKQTNMHSVGFVIFVAAFERSA
jgi:hypothetical protein